MPDEPQDRLTLQEHLELSQEIKHCVARLRPLAELVVEVYGPGSRPGVSFLTAMSILERLNRELREQAAADLPPGAGGGLYS